jgi:heptosyltransferase II
VYSKILIRATNWVGDAVMCLPALRAVRRRFPNAHLAILARPWVADLYEREPFCDEMIPYAASGGNRNPWAKWKLAAQLRARRFDCALLLQNAFDAALIAWLARIPVRVGYNRDGRRMLLTHPIRIPERGEIPRHESFYCLELLRRAGWIEALPSSEFIRLEGAAQARERGRERLRAAGLPEPVIGVSPGAAYGTAKRWLPERFAGSAARLASELSGSIALFGSPGERELCAAIAGQIAAAGHHVHNFAGETRLREYIELAASCRVYLTNDSGAMHIASALGVPTVAIFGATDDTGTGPTGPLARVVREPVECAPCLLRECPIDHRCMTRVSAERVAEVALDLLK